MYLSVAAANIFTPIELKICTRAFSKQDWDGPQRVPFRSCNFSRFRHFSSDWAYILHTHIPSSPVKIYQNKFSLRGTGDNNGLHSFFFKTFNSFFMRSSWKCAHALPVTPRRQFRRNEMGILEASSLFEKFKFWSQYYGFKLCLWTAKSVVQNEGRNNGKYSRSLNKRSFRLR